MCWDEPDSTASYCKQAEWLQRELSTVMVINKTTTAQALVEAIRLKLKVRITNTKLYNVAFTIPEVVSHVSLDAEPLAAVRTVHLLSIQSFGP